MQAKKKGKKVQKGPSKYPQGVRRNQVRFMDPDSIANDLEEDKTLLLSGMNLSTGISPAERDIS